MDVRKDSGKNQSNRQMVTYGSLNDGNISFLFSDNDLEVHADFLPPLMNGTPLNIKIITEILESVNLVYGVKWDAIELALEECNASRRQVRDVLIAVGEAAEVEIAEYYELNHIFHKKPERKTDHKERIDYRDISPFTIVKKGQVLATLKPRRPGKEGMTVRGVPMPFGSITPEGVTGGTNTRIEGNSIVAAIHGQLIIENKTVLNVQDTLIIKGAVDYSTGNIVFPGDVFINGPVSDGFKIFAGGSLTIKQTLDLTRVVTKGDILVSGGIVGKGDALIKSGGSIRTKFIEKCRVAARNSVLVDLEILHSDVFALNTVEMGEKGKIVGGNIYAVHGLRTGAVGRKGSPPTHIHCGVDFAAQQEKENCNSQLHTIAAKLRKLREMLDDAEHDEVTIAKINVLVKKLEEERKTITERLTKVMGNINIDDDTFIEVSGEIAAGSLIEICQVALFVEEPLKKVRIRLDKEKSKLYVEQL
ncbi:MAG: FapA family protein [Treponema sp.]|jgi:uncharacterized protein (DUF342 family)|nr:FapA family protein [Treponema sp.]